MLLLLVACAGPGAPDGVTEATRPAWERLDTNHDGKVVEDEWKALALEGPDFGVVDTDGDHTLSLAELVAYADRTDPLSAFNNRRVARPGGGTPSADGAGGGAPNAPGAAPGPGSAPGPGATVVAGAPGGGPGPSTANAPGGAAVAPSPGVPGTAPGGPGGTLAGGPPAAGGPSANGATASSGTPAERAHRRQQHAVLDLLRALRAEVEAKVPADALPTDAELVTASDAGSVEDPRCRAVLGRLTAAWAQAGLTLPTELVAPGP